MNRNMLCVDQFNHPILAFLSENFIWPNEILTALKGLALFIVHIPFPLKDRRKGDS